MKPLIPAILTAFVAAAAHASEPIILADFEEKKAPPAPTITGHWSKSDPGEVPELVLQTARQLREKHLADPTRPGYHFACVDGFSWPGDPNGAFYAKGR